MITLKLMRWVGVVACGVMLAVGGNALAETATTQKTPPKAKTSTTKAKTSATKTSATKSTKSTKAKTSTSSRASLPNRTADPCLGAIVVDAATGQVLLEQNADVQGFPASVIKLMDMMVLMDQISEGKLSLSNAVTVTAASSKIGGSQVYLKEGEVFTLEDLMYALMIQSANDSAMAMAVSVSGSSEGFVELMNQKAAEIGMTNTVFYSVHGLPPASGQKGDTSTPRDLAKLACALIAKHPDVLKYTSTQVRTLRANTPQPFVMRSHNHLLHEFPGCDGLKTGFINAGGFSIVATAQRNGRRVIAVVLGSKDRKVRDAKAKDLLAKGFTALPPLPPPPPVVNPVVTNLPATLPLTEEPVSSEANPHMGWLKIAGIGLVIGLVVLGIGSFFMKKGAKHDF